VIHISIGGAWMFVWGTQPTKAPRDDGTVWAKSGLGAKVLWTAERSIFQKGIANLPWVASELFTRRAWHIQLWPVDQPGYALLARQCCMVAHPCSRVPARPITSLGHQGGRRVF